MPRKPQTVKQIASEFLDTFNQMRYGAETLANLEADDRGEVAIGFEKVSVAFMDFSAGLNKMARLERALERAIGRAR